MDRKIQVKFSLTLGTTKPNALTQLRILGLGHGAEIGASILIELNNRTYLPLHTLTGDISALIDTQTKQPLETYHYTAFGEEQTTPGAINPNAPTQTSSTLAAATTHPTSAAF